MTTPHDSTSWLFRFRTDLAVLWLKWRSSLILAVRSLWLHKLRAGLSVLGIIIGTAAVIILMSFGKGSMEDALEDIRRQGTTNIIIKSIQPPDDPTARSSWVANYGLTWDDYDRCGLIEAVIGIVPMRVFPYQVRHLDKVVMNARVVATTEAYATINNFQMAAGRFLVDGEDQQDEGDEQRARNVIVLGARVAEELFPFEQAIGKSVVLKNEQYVVVGVIKDRMPRGVTPGSGQAQEDFNNDVYIPLYTCKLRFGQRIIIRQGGSRSGQQVELHQIILTVADIDKVRTTGEVVRDLLARYHQKQDWEVVVPLDRLEAAERERARFMVLLAIIGGISLLVGGIGIMNIMLATVTERTREIGIRRALGAKRRDITMQFIIEAVVQTSIGGMLGIAVGLVIVYGLPPLVRLVLHKALPVKLDIVSIFLSLGVAVGVGVLFGWYPARRASRLDPIEALRHN
jgi:putative ABC transport system permease protein